MINVTNKFALIVKGGDLNYVHSNKKTRRIGRFALSKISQEDSYVWPFAGTS
jgi:hypothetical protein